MRKISVISAFLLLVLSLTSCGIEDDHNINIAVICDPDLSDTDYLYGMQLAINDLRNDYENKGFKFDLKTYNNENSYASGAAIIEELAADNEITAVIASDDTDVTKTAAHVFKDKNRIEYYDIEHSAFEDRYITIGEIDEVLIVILVVYTERSDVIRIISARKATKQERRAYYDYT